ncbi:MAG: DUF4365 domain-containing protein [Terriglobales bacterium]|jgi:hypothetical protein
MITEDLGLAKIHRECALMSAIWRPTPSHDLGIDGQIEFLNEGTVVSTGLILAVQSKSGASYCERVDENDVLYYPTLKHRTYWGRILLPVLLVLYEPDSDLLIFASVKPQLQNEGPIRVSRNSVFNQSARSELLRIAREDLEVFSPHEALEKFFLIKLGREGGKTISGIEFLLASVDRQSEYFSLRMCRIKSVFELLSAEAFFGIGGSDYEYIFRCSLEFEGLRLADSFISEFNEVWFGLNMVPDITLPLNQRGRSMMGYLWDHLSEFLSISAFAHLGFSKIEDLAHEITDFSQKESDRLDRSDRLGMEPR